MSNGSETIVGSYHVMPDGTMMQKLANGKWVSTEDRLKEAEEAITNRFDNATTIPSEWQKTDSSNVTRKKERHIEDIMKYSPTHRGLHGHLIEMLGSPTEIIKNGKLSESIKKKTINDYHIRRSAQKIIESLNCEPWNTVLKIMNGDKE